MPGESVMRLARRGKASVLDGLEEDHDLADGAGTERVAPSRHALCRTPLRHRLEREFLHPVAVTQPEAPEVTTRLGAHGVGRVAVRAVLVEEAASGAHG